MRRNIDVIAQEGIAYNRLSSLRLRRFPVGKVTQSDVNERKEQQTNAKNDKWPQRRRRKPNASRSR